MEDLSWKEKFEEKMWTFLIYVWINGSISGKNKPVSLPQLSLKPVSSPVILPNTSMETSWVLLEKNTEILQRAEYVTNSSGSFCSLRMC